MCDSPFCRAKIFLDSALIASVTDQPRPRTWIAVRNLAVVALRDNLAFLKRTLPGTALTPRGQQPQFDGTGKFVCNASRSGIRWTEQQYFLVQVGQNPRTLGNRYDIDLHRFAGQRLFFTVPPATQMFLQRIADTTVQVYYIDDLDVQLKTQLLKVLQRVESGDLVPVLWDASGRVDLSPRRAPGQNFNPAQQAAYSAMTGAGAFFIWGPPGTGKTKVISAAVECAIRDKRSVLIASHTHIAVDNVLQKLMNKGFAVGTLIRVPPSDRSKVAADVRAQGELLTDQAAAILVDRTERLQALQDREASLSREIAGTRSQVINLNDELSGFDGAALSSAQETLRCRDATQRKKQDLAQIVTKAHTLRQEAANLESVRDDEAAKLAELPRRDALVSAEGPARTRRLQILADIQRLEQALGTLAQSYQRIDEDLAEARRKRDSTGKVATLFGARTRRSAEVEKLAADLADARSKWDAATEKRRKAELDASVAGRALLDIENQLQRIDEVSARRRDLDERLRRCTREVAGLNGITTSLESEITRLATAARGADDAELLVQRYRQLGFEQKWRQREVANSKLQGLLDEQAALTVLRDQVEADLRNKKDELLRTAPVIACTLSSLASQSQLIQRTFDVVIVDEVANAGAAHVVYAASRARRTVALVGDFLQNAPIADSDDPVGPSGPVSVAWQRKEVFALAGIVDRATAEAHAHCVPLARQYRYPSIVADVVNAFCYDDLLESEQASVPSDGPTITFVDTSGMESYRLVSEYGSWYSDGGIEILVSIARAYAPEPGAVGFVTPYAAQKARAERRVSAERLAVQCGTSHTFQGKEVPILIFDMMQDRIDRWVGVADLKGSDRQVSAAKLLNVAITRMQRRLFIIGDWKYVRASDRPGMRALCALASRDNFRLVSARDIVDGSVDIVR